MNVSPARQDELQDLLVRELVELKESDQVLREMLAQSPGVLWIAEPDTDRIVYCGPGWAEIWGRPLSDRPRTISEHVTTIEPADHAQRSEELRKPWAGRKVVEYRINRPDGSQRWIRDTLFVLPCEPGKPRRVAGLACDVTAEKTAALSRERSESLFSAATENAHTMMLLADAQGVIHFTTRASESLLGNTVEETVGRPAADFVVPEDLGKVLSALQQCVSVPGGRAEAEARLRHRDGSVRTVQLAGTNLLHEPAVGAVVVTMHDISALRAREEELRANEQRLRTVLDSLHMFVGLLTPDGTLQFANRAALDFLRLTDTTQLIGRHFADTPYWSHAPSKLKLLDAIAEATKGRSVRFDAVHVSPSGVELTVDFALTPVLDAAGRVLYLVPAGVDVTARELAAGALRQKEQELLQVQKMEAVGRLAGGVAHDFNNIITAVMAFSDMVLMDLPQDSPSRDDVAEIRKAADRAQALTRQLLAFSRHQVMEPRAFMLCQQVKDMVGMLTRLVGEDVNLQVRCDGGRSRVFADPGQIEQIVLNLAVNARDAMPSGGVLDVVLDHVRRGGEGGAEGDWVRLTVRDTGHGMTPDVMEHAFEPFFTTKAPGQGTGLGLSTVYGIVKQSGGLIELESQVGEGTTFTILFPEFTGELEGEPEALPRRTTSSGAGETVLLVEDDDVVRSVSRRVLERDGFHVIEATNGAEGLAKLRQQGHAIALVITDIVMPQMSGLEMLRAMRTLDAHPAILVTSGYTEETLVHHGNVPADARFLDKPFTGEALLEAVRGAMQLHGALPAGMGATL